MANTGFVLLEITQPEIRSLLRGIQRILTGTEPRLPVHVTLRGPYKGRVAPEFLDRLRETLRKDTLRIGGVGRFSEPEEVVFLRVDSPNLRGVSWKADYPKKDGHQPHISLYRGRDAAFADRVADFLAGEELQFSCAEYKLWIHRSGSLPWGPTDATAAEAATGCAPEGTPAGPQLLSRLRRFVDEYQSSSGRRAARGMRNDKPATSTGAGPGFAREEGDLYRPPPDSAR